MTVARTPVNCAEAACQSVGIVFRHCAPGRTIRVPVEGKGSANRSGSIKVDPDGQTGVARNWATNEYCQWDIKRGTFLPKDEWIARQREREQEAQKAAFADRIQTKRMAEFAAGLVREVCPRPINYAQHPYLARKFLERLSPCAAKVKDINKWLSDNDLSQRLPGNDEDLALVFPLRLIRPGFPISTLQFILPDGSKRFLAGAKKEGAAWLDPILVGDPSGRGGPGLRFDCQEVGVAEGIATAHSVSLLALRKGKRVPCIAAMDCGNLAPVCQALAAILPPGVRGRVYADRDPSGIGEEKATEATRQSSRFLDPVTIPDGVEGTDFNDQWIQIRSAETAPQGGDRPAAIDERATSKRSDYDQ